MKVCKFGGSSLADAEQVRKVCDIVLSDADRRIVVVSAPGKRDKADTKVTDLLIACAESRFAGNDAVKELDEVVARYDSISKDLGLPDQVMVDIRSDLEARLALDPSHQELFMDSIKAAGEDNSARLVAAEFQRRDIDARYLSPADAGLLLSDDYGNAQLLPESYDNLAKALDTDKAVTVFPGFFGHTKDGNVATFPRGGSDITGAVLAAAVKAEIYENFTDVDSVLSADPDMVPDAKPVAELTYAEMRELAYAGFGVLHDEAILPAVHAGVPICIKNTNMPDMPGTRIVLERDHQTGHIVGVACSEGFCSIFVSKYLMNREVGFGRRLLQILEEEGLSYEHMPSGIDSLSIILREKDFDAEKEKHVCSRIKNELGVDDVEVEHGLALIMIVGEGMYYSVGVSAKVTRALADAAVNIEMINQGSSEISIMFGVKADQRVKAVQSIYKAFFDE
jgi:aspartate kinase